MPMNIGNRPTLRSDDPADYQDLPRPVAAFAKDFEAGARIAPHSHKRGQLLFAASGVMRVTTAVGAWIVPPRHALWIPPKTVHSLAMPGALRMRTLYIAPRAARRLPAGCTVIDVSDLLCELILASMDEPVVYDPAGRGGLIMRLILDEIGRAGRVSLHIPLPRDRRLRTLCEALLSRPHDDRTLDQWAEQVGASVRTLARLFRRETGLGFVAWRQQVRLADALARLQQGEAVSQIARRLGYRSASAFTAMFRRVLGASPRHYGKTAS